MTEQYAVYTMRDMAKKALAIRIDPDLFHGLDMLQKKLEHRSTRTTLIEDAIRSLLEKNGISLKRRSR